MLCGETERALELGWDGDMSFIAEGGQPPNEGGGSGGSPEDGSGGASLQVDPQKTMCRI